MKFITVVLMAVFSGYLAYLELVKGNFGTCLLIFFIDILINSVVFFGGKK